MIALPKDLQHEQRKTSLTYGKKIIVKKYMEEKDMKKIIEENLRKIQFVNNLTQKEVAKLIGVTFRQIQKYEKGTSEISATDLHKIATHFGLKMDDFTDKITLKTNSSNDYENDIQNQE